MIKSRFAQFLDTCLFVIGFSLVLFAWINKYLKLTLWSVVITAVISFIIAKIIWNKSTKKYNKQNLKTQELKFAQNCIDYLALNPDKCLNFFAGLLKDSKINGNFLVYENNLYYFDYSSDQTTLNTLTAILKMFTSEYKNCYLFSSKLSEKTANLITQTNITWVQDYDCYLFMKKHYKFPITEQKSAKIQKNKFKTALKQSISRKKAKPYFLYGALLLATSFIMPYSLLYCTIGSISIVLSLICLLVKNQTASTINLP